MIQEKGILELFIIFIFQFQLKKCSKKKIQKFKRRREHRQRRDDFIIEYGLNLYLLMKIENDAMFMCMCGFQLDNIMIDMIDMSYLTVPLPLP